MTTGRENGRGRRVSVGATATGLAVLGAVAMTAPATAAASHLAGRATSAAPCAQAMHRFVEADSAKVERSGIKVTAHKAKFHCGGEDDGHYSVAKATETLTISPTAKISVYKVPENPSVSKTITASKLPHWLKKNRSEPIYRIAGPKSAITKMTEQFHP